MKYCISVLIFIAAINLNSLVGELVLTEVFRDDFDSVNTSKWELVTTNVVYNNELEYYVADEISTQSGNVVLRAQNRTYGTSNYTSGKITTKGKYQFTYGVIEFRAQLPAGKGLWPALWLMTPAPYWPPEIDVMEARGDRTNVVSHAVHFGRYPNNSFKDYYYTSTSNFTSGFHTFKVIWEPIKIEWYVDGIQTFNITNTSIIPQEPLYIIINLAVGGTYGGNPDATTIFPAYMIVDYVSVSQWINVTTTTTATINAKSSALKLLFDLRIFFVLISYLLLLK